MPLLNWDFERLLREIKQNSVQRVFLQFPEGLVAYSHEIATKIERDADCEVIVSADIVYGACCVDDIAASKLDCDLMVHFGHSKIASTKVRTLYVPVHIDFDVGTCVNRIKSQLPVGTRVYLCSTVQFSHQLKDVQSALSELKYSVQIAKLHDFIPGEFLGCTVMSFPDNSIVIYIGDGQFHPEALNISNPSLTIFQYNTYSGDFVLEEFDHSLFIAERKRTRDIFFSSKRVGLICSTYGKQGEMKQTLSLKEKFKKAFPEKDFQVFLMGLVTPESLCDIKEVDVWLECGCPRLAVDWNSEFEFRLLNVVEANLLLFNDGLEKEYKLEYWKSRNTSGI